MAFQGGRDGASWQLALRRAARGLSPRRGGRRTIWSVGVPLIALAAGLLFTTSATTADGTALRDDRRPQLAQLIADKRDRLADSEKRAAALRAEVDAEAARLAEVDTPVKDARQRADAIREPAGFTALHGPGLTVTLNDSPRRGSDFGDNAPDNDDLVVHQGDVQAVVNAMWAGGAEAMTIMNVRVISTSAVRCVGNTLLLHNQVFSPPFKITAIGEPTALHRALESAEGVRQFREAVADFGLGYAERNEKDVTVPAYDGSTDLRSAQAAQ
ncbi:membrane protein [Actinoplanes ianthinogenes]|uniref:Membrane protein n=1 Tax=Actinoplanes ianthinogenes TaxID=122358 RepID=A0ABN6CDJ7_9ACTN|nr:membrane protein [Actinoplanes ianthinogenes]GGR18384.1 membrane protein [Actinoplanes ianthinogenes]